jgi:hypothetical protein
MRAFSLRLPDLGLAWGRRRASGYLRLARRDRLRMIVRAPAGGRLRVLAAGRPVRARRRGRDLVFGLTAPRGRRVSWSIAPAGG